MIDVEYAATRFSFESAASRFAMFVRLFDESFAMLPLAVEFMLFCLFCRAITRRSA